MTEPRRCECVQIYRVAALAVSAVLLVALVAMLLMSAEHGSTDPTTTTSTSLATTTTTTVPLSAEHNDGVISEAERVTVAPTRTLVALNQLARLVCTTVVSAPTREAVRTSVYTQLRATRLNLDAEIMAMLTERVARAACEDAWLALP